MKYLITLFLLVSTFNANAFTISQQAKVKIWQYNDLLNKSISQDVSFWTGVDDDGVGYAELRIDSGLKRFDIGFTDPLNNPLFAEWKKMLDKTVEWAVIAAANEVDIVKYFNEQNKSNLDCTNDDYHCGANFASHRDGQNSALVLFMQDKDNQFYEVSGPIMLDDVLKLSQAFSKTQEYINERKLELADKIKGDEKDDLFKL
jgi:hypothetical protein